MNKKLKIGNFDVDSEDVFNYVRHFGRDKTNIASWEVMRKTLHDYIFSNLGLSRQETEGQEFSKALDEFCEPYISKYAPVVAKLKKLGNAKTPEEMKNAERMLEFQMEKEKFRENMGTRNFNAKDSNFCRVCEKDIPEGEPRYNDHLFNNPGFTEINQPICCDCASNNPDDYHKEFKRVNG